MIKTVNRGDEVSKLFAFFMSNEWIYEAKSIKKLANLLTEDEKKTFFIAIEDIDQAKYIQLNNYGIQKHILKEHAEYPIKPNENILFSHNESDYFNDFKWVLNTQMPIRPMN